MIKSDKQHVILCPVGVESRIRKTIGNNFVTDGEIVFQWGFGRFIVEDGEDHANMQWAENFKLPLNMSFAVSGITPQELFEAFGLTRCNEDGSEIIEE